MKPRQPLAESQTVPIPAECPQDGESAEFSRMGVFFCEL